MDHETYIRKVAEIAMARLPEDERAQCAARLVYGAGKPGVRGTTYYGTWANGNPEPEPLVEVAAFGESDAVQLAGTTIHEIGHVLAGHAAGHGKAWKDACNRLGLRCIRAAGTRYQLAMLAPDIREQIAALPAPEDGYPVGAHRPGVPSPNPTAGTAPKPCPAGIGSKGGTSRGKGSGSRLRKWVCGCGTPIRASKDLNIRCEDCGERFEREDRIQGVA